MAGKKEGENMNPTINNPDQLLGYNTGGWDKQPLDQIQIL